MCNTQCVHVSTLVEKDSMGEVLLRMVGVSLAGYYSGQINHALPVPNKGHKRDHQNWSDYAADRSAWRLISSKGVTLFEETRRDTIKDKRSRRKARAASAVSPDLAFSCRLCSRACRSRIGLFSHEQSCRQSGHSLPS
ncbi:hypothetical protein PoB_001258400 [Plakobranchus ocellatus]|uniref:C2H2-type domain-containing protein n=1 Tax=Plakobranchus ocellatus TaxID=259542 RepID=A0AAV3YWI2_9GAST|nr:hypothetical protein PoB_001258400 [Plakobranchus ocellatus]